MERLTYKKENSEKFDKFVCKIDSQCDNKFCKLAAGDVTHVKHCNFLQEKLFRKISKSIVKCSQGNARGHAQCLPFRA